MEPLPSLHHLRLPISMATLRPFCYTRSPAVDFRIEDITEQLEDRNYDCCSSEKPEKVFVNIMHLSHTTITVRPSDITEIPIERHTKTWGTNCEIDMIKLMNHHESIGILHGLAKQCGERGGPGGDPVTNKFMVKRIIDKGLEFANKACNKGRKAVGMCVYIEIKHVGTYCSEAWTQVVNRTEEEMILEMSMEDDPDKGMVPASESSIAKVLTRVRQDEESQSTCTVCIEELKGGSDDEVVVSMPCEHRFHQECIVTWLKQSHYCPICRYEVPTD